VIDDCDVITVGGSGGNSNSSNSSRSISELLLQESVFIVVSVPLESL